MISATDDFFYTTNTCCSIIGYLNVPLEYNNFSPTPIETLVLARYHSEGLLSST